MNERWHQVEERRQCRKTKLRAGLCNDQKSKCFENDSFLKALKQRWVQKQDCSIICTPRKGKFEETWNQYGGGSIYVLSYRVRLASSRSGSSQPWHVTGESTTKFSQRLLLMLTH